MTKKATPAALAPTIAALLGAHADAAGDPACDLETAFGETFRLLVETADGFDELEVADLDGDGVLDVVVGWSDDAGGIAVFLSTAEGDAAPILLGDCIGAADDVVLADLDGDGDLDLVTNCDFTGESVIVHPNEGDGTFAPPIAVPAIGHAGRLLVRDVDGDGLVDIACVGEGDDLVQVALLRGDGALGFAAPELTPLGPIGGVAIWTDIDGDGDPDLVRHRADDVLEIVRNDGTGAFTLETAGPLGFAPEWTASGDLDGDGDGDLVVADRDAGVVRIVEQAGPLAFAIADELALPPRPARVSVQDLDGDDDPELVVLQDDGENSMTILRGGPGVSFEEADSFIVFIEPGPFRTADVDGDGDLDVVGLREGFGVQWIEQRDVERWAAPSRSLRPTAFRSIRLVDMDGDGRPELLGTSPEANTASIVPWVSRDRLGTPIVLDVGGEARSLAAADLDGDGRRDLVVTSQAEGNAWVFFGQPDGTFVESVRWPVGPDPLQIELLDADGDGDADMVVRSDDDQVRLRRNAGNGFFFGAVDVVDVPMTTIEELLVADVDGDGDLDVAAVNPGDVALLRNQGGGGLVYETFIGETSLTGTVFFADVDGDGALDVVRERRLDDQLGLRVYPNDGSGGFGAPTETILPFESRWTTPIDVDGDGRSDVLMSVLGSLETVRLLSTGAGTFEIGGAFVIGPSAVRGIDVDGNGTQDLLTRHGDASLGVLLNRCVACFGDIDRDGMVSYADLVALLASWGPCTGACLADLDFDGVVGTEDLMVLLAGWGADCDR